MVSGPRARALKKKKGANGPRWPSISMSSRDLVEVFKTITFDCGKMHIIPPTTTLH